MAAGISLRDGTKASDRVFDEWLAQIREYILIECKDDSGRAQGLGILKVNRQYDSDGASSGCDGPCMFP